MYTIEDLFVPSYHATMREWLRRRREHAPDAGDFTADYVDDITPLGVAVFTMAGGTVGGISSHPAIRLPAHVQVSLLSAEP